MKPLTTAILALAASPALAHADGSFHSHGVEVFLILAVAAIAVAVWRS